MIRWTIRVILAVLSLILLSIAAFAGLPWFPVLADQFGAGAYRSHLAANETVLDLDVQGGGFVLHEDHLDARYVIMGEMHGYALPQILDFKLVNYLQTEGPPRWYLAELTPREAIAVNAFLTGEDQLVVESVVDRLHAMGAQWGNTGFIEKLLVLSAISDSLPADRKIRFIGIDLDRDGDALTLPEPQSDSAPDLSDTSTARAINDALLAVQPETNSRYAAMRARLTRLSEMPGFEDARFVGLWGLFHASEAPINNAEPFARWLQHDDAPYRGDVVTINTLCVGQCFNMMPADALPEPLRGPNGEKYTWLPMGIENPYFQRPRGIGDLMHTLGPDRAALYHIGGEGSPYATGNRLVGSSGYLAMMQPWEISGSATDMTDYILIYRDTPPLRPWNGEAFDITGQAADAR